MTPLFLKQLRRTGGQRWHFCSLPRSADPGPGCNLRWVVIWDGLFCQAL